jgi:hypothetical protein
VAQAMQLSDQDELMRSQADQIATQAELIRQLEDDKGELRRRLGASST